MIDNQDLIYLKGKKQWNLIAIVEQGKPYTPMKNSITRNEWSNTESLQKEYIEENNTMTLIT